MQLTPAERLAQLGAFECLAVVGECQAANAPRACDVRGNTDPGSLEVAQKGSGHTAISCCLVNELLQGSPRGLRLGAQRLPDFSLRQICPSSRGMRLDRQPVCNLQGLCGLNSPPAIPFAAPNLAAVVDAIGDDMAMLVPGFVVHHCGPLVPAEAHAPQKFGSDYSPSLHVQALALGQ